MTAIATRRPRRAMPKIDPNLVCRVCNGTRFGLFVTQRIEFDTETGDVQHAMQDNEEVRCCDCKTKVTKERATAIRSTEVFRKIRR